jgi:hypothetical protein
VLGVIGRRDDGDATVATDELSVHRGNAIDRSHEKAVDRQTARAVAHS